MGSEIDQTEEEELEEPKKSIGLRQLLSKGLGGTIGGPIFAIIGTVIMTAKGGMLISLILNGLLMLGFVLIYSELALSLPIEGGSYSFSKEAVGGGQGYLIGWLIWIGNLLFAALSGLGFALSLEVFLPNRIINPNLINIIGASIIIVFLILNLKKPIPLNKAMKIATWIILGGFLIYIVIGLIVGSQIEHTDFSGKILSEPFTFLDVLSMTGYTFVIYCVYEWNSTFESLTNAFDQIKKPRKNIPRTFIFSILIAIFIYWMVGLVTLLNLGEVNSPSWNAVIQSESKVPLADMFGRILNNDFGIYFMGFIGMVATITSINAGIQMSTHILHSMSRDGFIHNIVQKKKNGVQWVAMTISGVLMFVFTLSMDISLITEASNFIFLFSMIFLSLAVMILRKSRPNLIRPWKVPLYPFIPILSIITSLILIFSMFSTVQSTLGIIFGVITIVVGGIYYLFQKARRDRLLLMLYGSKMGISLLFVLVLKLLKIDIRLGTETGLEISNIFNILAIIAIFSLIFDVVPIRSWILKILKQEGGTVIVGGITRHSERGELLSRKLKYGLFGIVLSLGLIFLLFSLFIGFDLLFVGSQYFPDDSAELLQNLVVGLMIIIGIIYIIYSLALLLQEIEIQKLSGVKKTTTTEKLEKKERNI
ncbi:APC family permease [Candidatus Lokiarchaeum ossiferum]|uniref:APC family permease n=1 Tax=Candidatus Lokiarchaeum ossiferum TaxID=2951803 RepID=UPI00352EAF42